MVRGQRGGVGAARCHQAEQQLEIKPQSILYIKMQGLCFIRSREPWKMFIEELDFLKIEKGRGANQFGELLVHQKKKKENKCSMLQKPEVY